jgi:hypothetical protein
MRLADLEEARCWSTRPSQPHHQEQEVGSRSRPPDKQFTRKVFGEPRR